MKYRLVPMDFKIGTQGAFGTTTTQYGCAIHEEQGTLIATALAQTRREAKRRAAVIRDALLHDDAIRARAELADLRRRAQGVSIEEVVDALLRVQPFRDGHETGPTGLVRRADVEQVMRALFDRRVT